MKNLWKEILLIVITGIPFVYLAFIWEQLPQQVPTHFNFSGQADDWSSKSSAWIVGLICNFTLYFLFLVLPKLDPKRKLEEMGNKYFSLRLLLTIFFALLTGYIFTAMKSGSLQDGSILFALIGGLFAFLGNYFQTVRPNYFVGIRTPWTLENEEVWKRTHRIGGIIWMIGGILMIAMAFLLRDEMAKGISMAVIIGILTIVPIVYSYVEYKKLKIM